MAKLTRVTGKVFGGSAQAVIGGIGQFGSALAGTPNLTTDVATIQALPAYANGWGSAIISSRNFPPIEEVTGVLKTISYQACYMLQEGIPEYDINTEYSNTTIVKSINNGIVTLYVSLTNNNIGHPLTDGAYWKPYVLDKIHRNIGEIVTSTIPLNDADLHLLDGSLILGNGSYGAFVQYIASLVTDYPDLFVSEADYQASITQYGVCGKFVYDSVNNTVRLPKITGIVEGTTDVTALGDLVEAGLPDHNHSLTLRNVAGNRGAVNYPAWGGDDAAWTSSTGTTTNASSSNPIYGNSTTVQPQTIKVLYYIVIATSTKTDIEVDIDEIATDLNGKADIDLTNTLPAQSFIDKSVGWGIPDYSAGVSKNVGVDNTAESNGLLVFTCYTSSGAYAVVTVNSVTIASWSNHYGSVSFPFLVSKGDIYKATDGYGQGHSLAFYPLKGAN